jgi:hypothetical protein
MAADDSSDSIPTLSETRESVGPVPVPTDSAILSPAVRTWIEMRLNTVGRACVLSVHVLPGRWVFRIAAGGASSMMEYPTARTDCSSLDLATAVRKHAMRGGHSARIDTPHGGESRISVLPGGNSRS